MEFQVGLNYTDDPYGAWAHTVDVSLEEAMAILEVVPFGTLEMWNGKEWDILFNGAEEFGDGVQP